MLFKAEFFLVFFYGTFSILVSSRHFRSRSEKALGSQAGSDSGCWLKSGDPHLLESLFSLSATLPRLSCKFKGIFAIIILLFLLMLLEIFDFLMSFVLICINHLTVWMISSNFQLSCSWSSFFAVVERLLCVQDAQVFSMSLTLVIGCKKSIRI